MAAHTSRVTLSLARLRVGALVVLLLRNTTARGRALRCALRWAAQCCTPHAEAAFARDARRTCTPALAPQPRAKNGACACARTRAR
eukprot:4813547-Alexandrium_andersonii.AAC.1